MFSFPPRPPRTTQTTYAGEQKAAEKQAAVEFSNTSRVISKRLRRRAAAGDQAGVRKATRDLEQHKANKVAFIESKKNQILGTVNMNVGGTPSSSLSTPAPGNIATSGTSVTGNAYLAVPPPTPQPVPLAQQLRGFERQLSDREVSSLEASYNHDPHRALLSQVAATTMAQVSNAVVAMTPAAHRPYTLMHNSPEARYHGGEIVGGIPVPNNDGYATPSRSVRKKPPSSTTGRKRKATTELSSRTASRVQKVRHSNFFHSSEYCVDSFYSHSFFSILQTQTENPLVIEPEFAMVVRDNDSSFHGNILAIGDHVAGNWLFNLEDHITTIRQEYSGRDMYLVGYRDEERPNLFHEHERTSVPFFAVHTLASGSPAPTILVFSDLEEKTEERISIARSPFKWVLLHSFATGEKVHMLRFGGRITKHSTKTQSTSTYGSKVYFPNRFDSKQNPGDAFEIQLDGEAYFFDSEVWDLSKPGLKAALKESDFENWKDCCLRAKKADFLSMVVPIAMDAFFEYYESLYKTAHQSSVEASLSETFWAFRNKVVDKEKEYGKMELAVRRLIKPFTSRFTLETTSSTSSSWMATTPLFRSGPKPQSCILSSTMPRLPPVMPRLRIRS